MCVGGFALYKRLEIAEKNASLAVTALLCRPAMLQLCSPVRLTAEYSSVGLKIPVVLARGSQMLCVGLEDTIRTAGCGADAAPCCCSASSGLSSQVVVSPDEALESPQCSLISP
eukprot:353125-Chlamydomonas_euryale.AAC.6